MAQGAPRRFELPVMVTSTGGCHVKTQQDCSGFSGELGPDGFGCVRPRAEGSAKADRPAKIGDPFQNMYFAAKGGNWALAAYMSKYMNGAMNPASLTKPDEYKTWKSFYETTFSPVTKAIAAKDFKAFESAYSSTINACNGCHAGMGYNFVKVKKLSAPADNGIDYTIKSNPGDVPP